MRMLAFVVLLLSVGCAEKKEQGSYVPPSGFVPDEKTAVAIARIVWQPIYGERSIASGEPYVAKLQGGIWYVCGTLPEGHIGGVLRAWIQKSDGRVIGVDAQQ